MWNIRDFSVFASLPQLKILSFLPGRGRQFSWGKPKTLPINELTKPEVFTQELVYTRASAGNLTEMRKKIGVPLSLGVELTHKRIRWPDGAEHSQGSRENGERAEEWVSGQTSWRWAWAGLMK